MNIKKIIYSLETKLILSFLLLILIISGMTFLYTFKETKDSLKEIMRDELKAVASVTATQINGDFFEKIQNQGYDSLEYQTILKQLNKIRDSNSDILYIYTMKKNEGKIEFVVDADYGKENSAEIGEIYDENVPELIKGFDEPSVDKEFTIDEWGTVMSGYAPIKNSEGKIVGLIGVDMDSKKIIEKQNFIGNTIYFIIGLSVIIASLIIGLFSFTIIKDIKKLNKTADEISNGNMNTTINIKRKDEIGELAESFGRMVASLKIMMMEKEEISKEEKTSENKKEETKK